MESREAEETIPVHVINIDIQDNHEEATIGAFLICELVALVGRLIFFDFPSFFMSQELTVLDVVAFAAGEQRRPGQRHRRAAAGL